MDNLPPAVSVICTQRDRFCTCAPLGTLRRAAPRRGGEREGRKREGRADRATMKSEKNVMARPREWEGGETSRLKYRVHVRSEHRGCRDVTRGNVYTSSRRTNNIRKFAREVDSRYYDRRMVPRLTRRSPAVRRQWPRARRLFLLLRRSRWGTGKTGASRCIAENDSADYAPSGKCARNG